MDPFSPKNLLMFMSSVVAGYEAPGLAQFVVSGKSPLTEGIGEARSEGAFGIALKKSGYDGIIISGKSETPSIIVIDDGKVSIKETPHLWGMHVDEVTDELKKGVLRCFGCYYWYSRRKFSEIFQYCI
ncbi:aldehyde ferredoxin oxidoreductase N-terminal domain-containing protein [Virgibacillus halophilus]|uniref:Aldehyde ferredoxin oxidoreductase N-terminal domain-containing protein n=1 Tax=Tigheibacillus halophilus TaxID=361280 RepID=A0ABU5C391_9BACI|nr:aldehyde ferredoxin oxidoreductase N-terminal domain-containing protein [Virgibacillus halophilus]